MPSPPPRGDSILFALFPEASLKFLARQEYPYSAPSRGAVNPQIHAAQGIYLGERSGNSINGSQGALEPDSAAGLLGHPQPPPA